MNITVRWMILELGLVRDHELCILKVLTRGSATPVILSPLSRVPLEHKSRTASRISHGGPRLILQLVLGLGNQKGTCSANAPRAPGWPRVCCVVHNGAWLTFSLETLLLQTSNSETTDCIFHPNKYKLWSKRSGQASANCRKCLSAPLLSC